MNNFYKLKKVLNTNIHMKMELNANINMKITMKCKKLFTLNTLTAQIANINRKIFQK